VGQITKNVRLSVAAAVIITIKKRFRQYDGNEGMFMALEKETETDSVIEKRRKPKDCPNMKFAMKLSTIPSFCPCQISKE
jgi:hypothetical protein